MVPDLHYQILYPDVQWVAGKFNKAPASTWKTQENAREFLLSIQHDLHVKDYEDWYRVSYNQVSSGLGLSYDE